jgi:flagellar protein FlaG
MSEISNITPAAIQVPRSQSTSEMSQTAISAVVSTASAVSPTHQISELKIESDKQLSSEAVKAAAVAGNKLLQATNKNLQFQVDEATKQVVVKIVDSKTGEVVRQIPTVEMLDFIRAMKEQEGNMGKLYQAKA